MSSKKDLSTVWTTENSLQGGKSLSTNIYLLSQTSPYSNLPRKVSILHLFLAFCFYGRTF